MYIPKHFSVSDWDEMIAFIEKNSFGQLISTVEGKLFSSHLPFEISADGAILVCHLARQNPQHLELEGQEVLVTFQGPHGYISPSWYAVPGAPTWNYQVVQVRGTCALFEESDLLKKSVETMAKQNESGFESPWQPDYDPKKLAGIVGVNIAISGIQCKYKLNQNRSSQDRSRVIERLNALGNKPLADAMALLKD